MSHLRHSETGLWNASSIGRPFLSQYTYQPLFHILLSLFAAGMQHFSWKIPEAMVIISKAFGIQFLILYSPVIPLVSTLCTNFRPFIS